MFKQNADLAEEAPPNQDDIFDEYDNENYQKMNKYHDILIDP